MKARQIPGSAAWESTSPIRLRLRNRAKVPRAPLLMPSSTEPTSTHRKLGSANHARALTRRPPPVFPGTGLRMHEPDGLSRLPQHGEPAAVGALQVFHGEHLGRGTGSD